MRIQLVGNLSFTSQIQAYNAALRVATSSTWSKVPCPRGYVPALPLPLREVGALVG